MDALRNNLTTGEVGGLDSTLTPADVPLDAHGVSPFIGLLAMRLSRDGSTHFGQLQFLTPERVRSRYE